MYSGAISWWRLTMPLEIVRSLPHGHVAAVLGTVRRLGVDGLIMAKKSEPASWFWP